MLHNKIIFLIKTFLKTESDGGDINLWRNISFRYSILDRGRFIPTINSAISERVVNVIGSPGIRLTAY